MRRSSMLASGQTRSAPGLGLAVAVAAFALPLPVVAEGLVPVLVQTPVLRDVAPALALTGEIMARVQPNLSFRVNGKVTARRVEVGQHVSPDDVLATLDPTEQQADVTNAAAALASARALLQQAQQTYDRQKSLISSGYTTRASFDQAEAGLNTSQAQVSAAEAALNTAREQLSYADLRPGRAGIIVSRSVEAGQVVQAGQTVFALAEDGPRDAVFAIPEALLTSPPKDNRVELALQTNPSVRTTGTVREISPILDAGTSTVTVKVGLNETPPAMTLGAAVIGFGRFSRKQAYVLPWSALFEAGGRPAVWRVDDGNRVALQPVEIGSYETGSFTVTGGLAGAERVVTAGTQLLYPGQTVAVVAGEAP